MPTLGFWILAVIVVFIVWRWWRKKDQGLANIKPTIGHINKAMLSIEKMEQDLYDYLYAGTRRGEPEEFVDDKKLNLLRGAQKRMKRDFTRLREKYTHDPETLSKIITDWARYIQILKQMYLHARESELMPLASDSFFDGFEELHIMRVEIERRFKMWLDEEYDEGWWKKLMPDEALDANEEGLFDFLNEK